MFLFSKINLGLYLFSIISICASDPIPLQQLRILLMRYKGQMYYVQRLDSDSECKPDLAINMGVGVERYKILCSSDKHYFYFCGNCGIYGDPCIVGGELCPEGSAKPTYYCSLGCKNEHFRPSLPIKGLEKELFR